MTIFRDRQDALRSQYAMLALMVLYTVGGLWILSHKWTCSPTAARPG